MNAALAVSGTPTEMLPLWVENRYLPLAAAAPSYLMLPFTEATSTLVESMLLSAMCPFTVSALSSPAAPLTVTP